MKINEAMILWNTSVVHDADCRQQVKVVVHGSDESRRYGYLSKSMGACCAGWKNGSPILEAAHLLCLFNKMVVDGVPARSAHSEMMQIAEYAAWHERREGPLAGLWWAWADPRLVGLEAEAGTEVAA